MEKQYTQGWRAVDIGCPRPGFHELPAEPRGSTRGAALQNCLRHVFLGHAWATQPAGFIMFESTSIERPAMNKLAHVLLLLSLATPAFAADCPCGDDCDCETCDCHKK